MAPLGNALLELAQTSRREFVMCAPFAKEAIVERVLSAVPADVDLVLYTRWRPEEVAAGVTDTGVLGLLQARGGKVFLHDQLHAKYYRNETGVLLGSANLTAAALGWSPRPNLELLTRSDENRISALERQLSSESSEATKELADEVDRVAALLPKREPGTALCDRAPCPVPGGLWIPQLRLPSDLYVAYSDGIDALTERSGTAAAIDLAFLDLPAGLAKEPFEAVVGHRILSQPLFQKIDRFLLQPRRFGEVRRRIEELVNLERPQAELVWQIIMRWIFEFQPHRYSYEVHRHSEVVKRNSTPLELADE